MLFNEEQKFRSWWLTLILLIAAMPLWWGFVQQIIYGIPFGNNPGSDLSIAILWVIFGILFPILFLNINLKTQFDGGKVSLLYFPFWKTSFLASDIEAVEKRKYNGLLEFGGWGIRWSFNGVIGYTQLGSDEGVLFTLKSGRKVFVSSQKASELEALMRQYIGK